jgi:hypothetical protein
MLSLSGSCLRLMPLERGTPITAVPIGVANIVMRMMAWDVSTTHGKKQEFRDAVRREKAIRTFTGPCPAEPPRCMEAPPDQG